MNGDLRIELGERSYCIRFIPARGEAFETALREASGGRPTVFVTDDNIRKLYPLTLYGHGESFVFEPGEEHKNLSSIEELCNFAAGCDLGRNAVFVAFGGGVTGDMTGFAAAVYMRGVDFIQIPTTLLAMVDSSVGGKTGVDVAAGKNLIGAFKQPLAVLIDPEFLRTLPRREFSNGLAEVVKYGAGLDRALFEFLEREADAIINLDMKAIEHLIRSSCRIKAAIVEADETEHGKRALLNLGHTLGHALETLSRFTISHGEGVAIGMRFAGELALLHGGWSREEQRRLLSLLEKFGLPTAIPPEYSFDDALKLMKHDKKASGGRIAVVRMRRLGESELVRDVPESALRQAWEAGCR